MYAIYEYLNLTSVGAISYISHKALITEIIKLDVYSLS